MEQKDFNPTKKDLLTIEALIIGIKQKKSIEVGQKMRYENTLANLKDKYNDVDLNSPDFKRIKNTRNNVKIFLHEIELKIKALNIELTQKNIIKLEVEHHLRNNKTPQEQNEATQKIITQAKKLKLKYTEFTKDRTRISSLRVMAAEFIDDLNELIDTV